jgi:hypothetical protein
MHDSWKKLYIIELELISKKGERFAYESNHVKLKVNDF